MSTKPTQKKPVGRPSKYTPEIAEQVCDLIVKGKGIAETCKLTGITIFSLYLWLEKHQDFAEKYARAKSILADVKADEIEKVARDGSEDELFTEDGRRVLNQEFVQRSKLIVDALKWRAAKLAPKKYGEKVQQELSGPDGGPIDTKTEITVKFVKAKNGDA